MFLKEKIQNYSNTITITYCLYDGTKCSTTFLKHVPWTIETNNWTDLTQGEFYHLEKST